MPQSADVLIVGAGAAGAAVAYFLAKEGVKATVVEKDAFASHASGFSFGMILPTEGLEMPGTLFPLTVEGVRLHKALAPELKENTSVDPSLRLIRCLSLCFDADDARAARAAAPVLARRGVAARWLGPDDVRAAEPRVSPEVAGALELSEIIMLESYRYVLALVEGAERLGATFRQGEVTSLARDGGGYRATLAGGDAIAAEKVVLAMGPWSGAAEKWLGLRVPVSPLKGQILRLEVTPPMECVIMWEGSYAGPKADGLTWAGTTEERVGFNENPTVEARDSIIHDLLTMAPALTEARVVQQTACLRPISADGLPIIGEAPGWPGVYLATGAGRKGIMLSPVMGRMVSDLIVCGRTELPTAAVTPARLARARG
jgi:glycine oxidase